MFREVFGENGTQYAIKKPPLAFEIAKRYQIRCTPQEAFAQLAELQIRGDTNGYDPTLDYQIFMISNVISSAISKSQVFPHGCELLIMGELWESPRGLTNFLISNIDWYASDWQTESWLLRLLEEEYDPQKHLEKASKLGLIDENTDPYILREALIRWKENDS